MINPFRNRGEAWPRDDSPTTTGHSHGVGFLWRIYALVPIFFVVLLSFGAIRYLFVSLLYPDSAPKQITAIPTRLTDEMLRSEPSAWIGQMLVDTPRMPLAHYHRIDGWFQPDPSNDCTSAGCHGPMPHARRKEVRAFLNMHATSIHCGICHIKSDNHQPLSLVWYDLQTGRAADTPALLQVHGWINSPEGLAELADPTSKVQERLVTLLRLAAEEAGDDPALKRLADETEAVRFTSDAFKKAVVNARHQITRHFHGEYGAKLALRDLPSGRPILGHPDAADAVTEFLQRGDSLGGAERAALLDRAHPQLRTEHLTCNACHGESRSLVDLRSVGYSPDRIKSLHEGWIFRVIEDIAAGRPLHLPEFVLPEAHPQPPASPESDQP